MVTEDDFQKRLNRVPHDWCTRVVFADWLEENGDPRAEGYRAMGRQRIRAGRKPHSIIGRKVDLPRGPGPKRWFFWKWSQIHDSMHRIDVPDSGLPDDWFLLVNDAGSLNPDCWRGYAKTRREVEDEAAVAFAKLPVDRRAELLNPGEPCLKKT